MLRNNIYTIFVTLFLGIIIASCGGNDKKESSRKFIAGEEAKGRKVFDTYCTACHQPDGKGKIGFGPSINNLDFLSIADDELIKSFILEGRPGTTMMPFKSIPDVKKDIDHLVAFIRSWEKDYELFKPVHVDKSWKSHGNATNGQDLFINYCASCHGDKGVGYIAGGSGTGIGNAAFLKLVSDDYIKQTLITGRVGTAMQSFAGAKGIAHLTDSDMDDIISYLREGI